MNEENNKLVPVEREGALVLQRELSVDEVANRLQKVMDLMKKVMKNDVHYGVIPGTEKPTLLKPGAELLGALFRLRPEYDMQWNYPQEFPGHIVVQATCRLYHIDTGMPMGEGVGSCSSLESKYRWRTAERKCPKCDTEAIIKGKKEYGGGWVCFKKKGGCGAKFEDNAAEIITQPRGRVENPYIEDQHNTVKKIAAKRAKADAILTATAASSIFTQDVEDLQDIETGKNSASEQKEKPPSKSVSSDDTPMTRDQQSKMFALGNAYQRQHSEFTDVKDAMKHVYKILKLEEIHSSTQLTKDQASQVIDYLVKEVSP